MVPPENSHLFFPIFGEHPVVSGRPDGEEVGREGAYDLPVVFGHRVETVERVEHPVRVHAHKYRAHVGVDVAVVVPLRGRTGP